MAVMSKLYYSVNGEIIGERTGAVRRDYLRDALGSVTATKVTSESTLQNTYRYKPYGARLAKTGVGEDPRFQWNGTVGYRQTTISHSTSYVRRRHLAQEEGRWTTVDRFWPSEDSYGYALSNPTLWSDPSGSKPHYQDDCCPQCGRPWEFCHGRSGGHQWIPGTIKNHPAGQWPRKGVSFIGECEDMVPVVNEWCRRFTNLDLSKHLPAINECIMKTQARVHLDCAKLTPNRIKCLRKWCTTDGVVRCYPGDIPGTTDIGFCPGLNIYGEQDRSDPSDDLEFAMGRLGKHYDDGFTNWNFGSEGRGIGYVFLHELFHACGVKHRADGGSGVSCNDIWACCFMEIVRGDGKIGNGKRCWEKVVVV